MPVRAAVVEAWTEELQEIGDRLGRAALAGVAAGLVAGAVGGLLSRVAMRVVGLMHESRGFAVTENGAVVGRITLEGSLFLVVLGAIAGALLGLAYVSIRRFLPAGRWLRAAIAGLVALALLGPLLVTSGNPDFAVLGNPIANVLLFCGLLVVAGAVAALAADATTPRIRPRPDDPWLYSAVYVAIALGSFLFSGIGFVLALVAFALPFAVLGARRTARAIGISSSLDPHAPGWWAGAALVGGVVAFGYVRLAQEVAIILA